MGLGLSIVQGIVHSFGGDITVESEVGRGTTFRVTFPSATTQVEEPGERGSARRARSTVRARVLIVRNVSTRLRQSFVEFNVLR
jgi:hypothetical protein